MPSLIDNGSGTTEHDLTITFSSLKIGDNYRINFDINSPLIGLLILDKYEYNFIASSVFEKVPIILTKNKNIRIATLACIITNLKYNFASTKTFFIKCSDYIDCSQ